MTSDGGFSKLSASDFESRPQRIETDRQFPLHLAGQQHVALNVAHTGRKPSSDRPAFRIVGIFDTVEAATLALEASRAEGCDGIIAPLHTLLLISRDTNVDAATVDETIAGVVARRKAADEEQKKKIDERVEYTRRLSNKSGDDEGIEEFKVPEVPVCIPNGESKGGIMKNLDDLAIVISVVGQKEDEPVVIVYGQFKTLEDAKIYIVNTLQEHAEFDVSVVAAGEWYPVDQFAVENTDLAQVDYLDNGMARLMELAKNSKNKTKTVKSMIKEEDMIAPEPDLLEPAPVVPSEATKQLLAAAAAE